PPQGVHKPGLARRDALFRSQHLRLVLLQLRGHVALRPRQRLASFVLGVHARLVRVRHLDVVAEDLVEANLERRDAAALALARLEPRDVALAAVARVLELVELAVVARADRVPLRELGRRGGKGTLLNPGPG